MIEQTLAHLAASSCWKEPLVIVGAGPVGMSAALGLAHYGVPSILLDDAEGTAIEGSRAIFMERHTLEILGAWSPVGRQMAEMGMTLTGGRVFFRKTELYQTFAAPPDPHNPYPRFVNMPQNLLERLQYEAIQATQLCDVRWQHKVVGLTQNDEGVRLEVQTPNGTIYINAAYVLAADGPKSTLRHLLKLNFPGESRAHHFLILDVRMQLETPRERWFWFDPPFNPGRTALLHPQPDSIYRIDYQLRPDEDLEAAKQPEALHQRIVATVGERPYEIVWKSVYSYQQRALEQFKHERVFFVGDAAHLMSPFGGRGLNSGVQDVWNLVWKLVLVRADLAPATLLDTYHEERHAAALENLRLTADTMRFLSPDAGFPQWKRDMILRLSLPFTFMRKHVNAGHMSNPFTYRASSLTLEDPLCKAITPPTDLSEAERATYKRYKHSPQAGSLAPVTKLIDAQTHTEISLLNCFGNSFVVLYFHCDADTAINRLNSIQAKLPDLPTTFYIITPNPPTKPIPHTIHVLLDGEQQAAHIYNAISGTLYLIRPDRHIAARRLRGNIDDCALFLYNRYAII